MMCTRAGYRTRMETYATTAAPTTGAGASTRPDAQQVPVNIYETDAHLVVIAPLPGVMADDIVLSVETGRFTVDAGLRSPTPAREYLVREWTYGPYHRTVAIPPGWGARMEASLGNGQLAVRIFRGDPPPGGVSIRL